MASMEMTKKTTKPGSPEYYQQLFVLLGENVIGGAWMFGYRESLLIQATYEVLPQILQALGVACVRYLKGLVPQLLHTLAPLEGAQPSIAMQQASLRALKDVILLGAPRIAHWSGEIVSGVAKCWILLEDKHINGQLPLSPFFMEANLNTKSDSVMTDLLATVLQDLNAVCPEETRVSTSTPNIQWRILSIVAGSF